MPRRFDSLPSRSKVVTSTRKFSALRNCLACRLPDATPYRFTAGLAGLSTDPALGPGWIVPMVHPHFVEPAKTAAGQDVTYPVPVNNGGNWATVDLWQISGTQSGPEYLHARTERLANGTLVNLNNSDTPPVDVRVEQGGYQALHYVDFTADGQVEVDCPQVQGVDGVAAKPLVAYSLVAAPDFFPASGQRELTEWVQSNAVPLKLRNQIWASNGPEPLSDQRKPANLQLPNGSFNAADTTITAVVGLPLPISSSPKPASASALRHSHFPDDTAVRVLPRLGRQYRHQRGRCRTLRRLWTREPLPGRFQTLRSAEYRSGRRSLPTSLVPWIPRKVRIYRGRSPR